MKKQKDYIRDIAEIRFMMERSSKFVSLSGWSGIMAGIYALAGAFIIYSTLGFNPGNAIDKLYESDLVFIMATGILVFLLAICTAVFHSYRTAKARGEKLWNPTARRMLINMAVPLLVGGLLICISILRGHIEFIASFSLVFYGLSLINASFFTFPEVKALGLVQTILGLLSSWFVEWGLFLWATGFGLVHILYGVYMHFKYEK